MAFVDDHERVVRQVVDEGRRRLSRRAPGEMPRVVLDPLAEAHLGQHFQVEARALLDALRFERLSLLLEPVDPLAQLLLDRLDRAQRRRARRDVVARRIDREARDALQDVPGQRIEEMDRLHLVVEKGQAHGRLRVLRGEDIEDVAAHPEHPPPELDLVALVLHGDQALDGVTLGELLAFAQMQDHAVVVHRIADPVDR